MKKPRLLTGKKLTKALDDIIREIVRLQSPTGICFVSQKTYGWFHPKENPKGCQVGHYISRRVLPLRWDLLNVFPQGSGENYTHQYNTLPFTARIIEVYGVERFNYLNKKYKEYHQGKKTMTDGEKRQILANLMVHRQKLIDSYQAV